MMRSALMVGLLIGAAVAARVVDREGNYYLCDKGQFAYFVYNKDTLDGGADYALRVFEVTKDKHKTGWVIWDCGFAETYEDALLLGEELKERAEREVRRANRASAEAAYLERVSLGLRTSGIGSSLKGKPVVATMIMQQHLAMRGPSLPETIANAVDIRGDSIAYWLTGTTLVAEQGRGDYFELRVATPEDFATLLPRIRDTATENMARHVLMSLGISSLMGRPVFATMELQMHLAMIGVSPPKTIVNAVDIRGDSMAYWLRGTRLVVQQERPYCFDLRMVTHDDIAILLPRIRNTWGGALAACGTLIISEMEPGASAEAVGMKPGDLLVEYDGTRVYTTAQLSDLRDHITGDSVPVALARNDSLIQVRIPAGTIGVYLKEDLPEFGEKKPWTGLRIAY